MAARPSVRGEAGGRSWTLIDAWRSEDGLGLGYFAAGREGAWGEAALDRRVALPAELDVRDVDERRFGSLWESARGLTPTERRIATDGDLWLVQATGPAWSGESAARDALGVRLRCLTTARPDVIRSGVTLDDLGEEGLRELAAQAES